MDDAISTLGNNIGSPPDVAVPTLPPPPLLEYPVPQMDDASVNLETIETSYNGSLEALENDQSDDDDGKNKTRRKWIKYKDQGVCTNYHVYLKPDSANDVIYDHRAADYIMTGVITEVPNQKNGMHYKICWNTADCNLKLEHR